MKTRRLTIHDIRQRNFANGGYFFDRATMKEQGETMKNFKLVKRGDYYYIHHKNSGTEWPVDPETGRVINSKI